MFTAKYPLAMWLIWIFARPFLWARDPSKRYNKSAGKHTFADYCLFFVRREIYKYLIDSYINSRDVNTTFFLGEQLCIVCHVSLDEKMDLQG